MQSVAGSLLATGRVGLLPAAFNPPTVAHMAIADTAQRHFALDQVVFVLCESMPHKHVERPGAKERLRWLAMLAQEKAGRAVAFCRRGLVIEIVRAFRAAVGNDCELFVIAGRDAAERFVDWDYGDGPRFSKQLRHFQLLVASREGNYDVPGKHVGRILPFAIDIRFDRASSSAVRRAVRSGEQWDHIVPTTIRGAVREAYREVRG